MNIISLSVSNGISGNPSDLGYASSWISYIFDCLIEFVFSNWILSAFFAMGIAGLLISSLFLFYDIWKNNQKTDKKRSFASSGSGGASEPDAPTSRKLGYIIDDQHYIFDNVSLYDEKAMVDRAMYKAAQFKNISEVNGESLRERHTPSSDDKKIVNRSSNISVDIAVDDED